ncbi:MAG: lycopene cyclase domain-containing protein [Actinomycetota bacterium]|nr:lycopene cyclase domain-containing protein [Actinomycetota bacterium]MDA3036272.1 lycopene cyclase domain-containing protein [Actinomycetota bacterium]
MVYTDIAIVVFIASIIADRFLIKSKLLTRKVFWTSYAIILFFQLLTNWWLTSRNIVMYNPDAIIGLRIASAPVEDLFFGFALVLLVMNLWVFWGKRGIQKK